MSAEFSFILAVPVLSLAAGYDLLKSFKILEMRDIPYFLGGGFVSFIVSWLAIAFFLKLLNQFKLTPFGWYRIILGTSVLLLTRN